VERRRRHCCSRNRNVTADVKAVELQTTTLCTGHAFRVLGYPKIDGATIEGLWATGKIEGIVRDATRETLQLTSQNLAQGMSGAPVLNEATHCVVGMVNAVYHPDKITTKHRDTAFATPSEILKRVCPTLTLKAASETQPNATSPATTNIGNDIVGRDKITNIYLPPSPSSPSLPSSWLHGHSFATSTNFVGRDEERKFLNEWIQKGPALLIIRALGGFGKSALAWQWLMTEAQGAGVKQATWWSFYDDKNFENFLHDTLESFTIDPTSLNPRAQMETLINFLIQPNTLIVMDGFERALRAFSGMDAAYRGDDPHLAPPPSATSPMGEDGRGCVSPLAENFLRAIASRPDIQSRILITTRLRPRVLEGHDQKILQHCKEIELNALSPTDAVTLFHALDINGTRAEIEIACAPYGYHPLSLRLLAGLIINDLREPKDIKVAQRLDVSGDLVQRQHHVLEQAYNSLTPERQGLLSRLACFRSPMTYEAMRAISDTSRDDPAGRLYDDDLRDLISRGLLHRDDKTNKYDLHPIVRRYAYNRLVDKSGTHSRLRDYFKAVEAPTKFRTLSELDPLIELYHHTVRAGQYDEAMMLFYQRINKATYFQFGAYQLQIELLRALFLKGEDQPPQLKRKDAQAWTLNELANSYSLNGEPRKAVPLFERQNVLQEKLNNKKNLAIGLENVAYMAQLHIGVLRSAEENLQQSIELCREIKDEFWEAGGHQELGRVLAYRAEWEEAEKELMTGLNMMGKQENLQGQCVGWAHRALRELLMLRVTPTPAHPHDEKPVAAERALNAARRALELAEGGDPNIGGAILPRDMVRAHWLLGAAHRANKNYDDAERHLLEALTRCRGINMVDHEGDILIDLARLRLELNEIEEAKQLAEEALTITERSGYVLQGADAHLVLAQLALRRNDKSEALHHAQRARTLATCDGEPYVYRVTYDEAGELIKEIEGNK